MLVAKYTDDDSGGGLLLAITLDGIPENLALGVSLIGTGPLGIAALTGSIFFSNLPEAAGGAKAMASGGTSKPMILLVWCATAVILVLAALAGYALLQDVSQQTLALIKSFAAGAIAASLATEVLPKAYREDHRGTGIAVTLGLLAAFTLHSLGAGA